MIAALALLVLLASLNGNLFVTPRVLFGLARDGLGARVLARVNAGGTPGTAMLLVGFVSLLLAATGTFERLLSLAIALVLVTDGFMVLVLFRLRARRPPRRSACRSTRPCRSPSSRSTCCCCSGALCSSPAYGGGARRAAGVGLVARRRSAVAPGYSSHRVVVAVELAGGARVELGPP